MQKRITTYKPNQRHDRKIISSWCEMAINIYSARELIWQLFKRDFFAVYKKSFIGYGWIILTPLFGIVQWVFLQFTGILQPGDVGLPYPIFILVGSSMWGLFIGSYHASSSTLSSGADLIMQVNYPHEALLFQQLANHLANFTITLCLNIFVLFSLVIFSPEKFSVDFPNFGMLLFPIVALPVLLFASSIGLIFSMVSIVAFDVNRLFSAGIGLLLFITPTIYTVDVINNTIASKVISWNPLTYLICSCRDILIYGNVYQGNWTAWSLSFLLSIFMFLFSWRLFYISETKIIERMV